MPAISPDLLSCQLECLPGLSYLYRVCVWIVRDDSKPITGFGSSVSEARVAACV